VAFQLFVRRRPLRELFAPATSRFAWDGKAHAMAAALATLWWGPVANDRSTPDALVFAIRDRTSWTGGAAQARDAAVAADAGVDAGIGGASAVWSIA
jgi:hypothetical protein